MRVVNGKKSSVLPDQKPKTFLRVAMPSQHQVFPEFLRSNVFCKLHEYDYISLGTIE